MLVMIRAHDESDTFQSAPGREAGRCAHTAATSAAIVEVSIRARP